jgi:branched-chain amino acid transport system ATP-binding protein
VSDRSGAVPPDGRQPGDQEPGDQQPGGAAGTAGVTPVLELTGIRAGYGQFQALFDLSVAIAPGQALAVVGHNGMGKTTLARVASGLIVPTAGRVQVDGRDLTGEPAHDYARAGIAHAPEGRSVFATLSVEENLALPFRRAFGRNGVRPALDRVYELFPRLGDRRTQLAGTMSGGEQRMLTLARVLVLEPRLLIADELSLGLAPIITDEVYRVLGRIKGSGTALLVIEQHVRRALEVSDRVVLLDRGVIVHEGPASDRDALMAAFGTTDEMAV